MLLQTQTTDAAPNPFSRFANTNNLPEVPSTLLKLHRIYTSHPPHDTELYSILHVSPNATTAEIQKSYRKLSRQWHPDKQRRKPNYDSEQCARELEKIQAAYNILKDDANRLPYHKYGLQDLSTAVLILTGYQNSPKIPTPQEIELLYLMGFHQKYAPPTPPPRLGQEPQPAEPMDEAQIQEQRVQFLAATILERIRPLVEGTLSDRTVADFTATECDRLKKLPLGAHILRCVGRAYRHAGQRYLKEHNNKAKPKLFPIRDTWHDAQHVWSAAVASGRVVMKENWLLKAAKQHQKVKDAAKKPKISYYGEDNFGGLFEEEDDDDFPVPLIDSSDDEGEGLSDQEMQQEELLKSEKVMVELLQVEALWKVHKISLNRAVKDACKMILSGKHFFFPSHQSTDPHFIMDDWLHSADGWVTASSKPGGPNDYATIDADVARQRAAAALVLIGNIMVEASKDGTAWMD